MEDKCIFVSSRGILKSMDIHSPTPSSSTFTVNRTLFPQNPLDLKSGSTIYICNTAIKDFIENILPMLVNPFILVSGDADISMPFEAISESTFEDFINDKRLIHWFCQNLMMTCIHSKMSQLPIGLDYHTLSKPGSQHPWGMGSLPIHQEKLLLECMKSSSKERILQCYSNFHYATFGINQRGDRQELLQQVSHTLIAFEPSFVDRETSWRHQSQVFFVLSPKGGGYDCHRTWEALCLGCIPIVKSSALDPLYNELPVLIVKNWSDINEKLLQETVIEFSKKSFCVEKLTLAYWIKKIKSKVECIQ